MAEKTLKQFKDWYIGNWRLKTPKKDPLTFVADTHGVILYRKAPYQVEMFIVKPNSTIHPHVHPNVDSYEVFISGDIRFTRGKDTFTPNKTGDSIHITPGDYHGGKFGERGGCFLSVQKWLHGEKPKFIGDDWSDKATNGSYAASSGVPIDDHNPAKRRRLI